MKAQPRRRSLTLALVALSIGLAGCQDAAPTATTRDATTRAEKVVPHTTVGAGPSAELHEMMMRPMPDLKLTGQTDRDYAMLMAAHHEQGIDMAKLALTNSKNSEIVRLARQMVDKQTKEREELESLANQAKETGKDQPFSKRMKKAMERPMEQGMTVTGDFDKDFAAMMARHHLSAINMSRIEVKRGSDPAVKQIAQKIIGDQRKERRLLLQAAGLPLQANAKNRKDDEEDQP